MNARGNVNHLLAFLAVANERSFTRAAAKLGVSQSALSHTIRGLEERLGLRLLTRTTRRVAPTEVGERLLRTVGPRFDEIDAELAALSELREKPAGTIRITTVEYAADSILWPALVKLLPQYPDIPAEIIVDYGLTDIVAVEAPARTSPPKLRDAILAYPTMAAGPGSLFSDVPSYRQCEATMADLTGRVAIATGASKGLGVAIAKALARTRATAAVNCATGGKERNESYKTDLTIL